MYWTLPKGWNTPTEEDLKPLPEPPKFCPVESCGRPNPYEKKSDIPWVYIWKCWHCDAIFEADGTIIRHGWEGA